MDSGGGTRLAYFVSGRVSHVSPYVFCQPANKWLEYDAKVSRLVLKSLFRVVNNSRFVPVSVHYWRPSLCMTLLRISDVCFTAK